MSILIIGQRKQSEDTHEDSRGSLLCLLAVSPRPAITAVSTTNLPSAQAKASLFALRGPMMALGLGR